MLTGKTLRDTARDLAIPGRSTMTADQLRTAIAVLSGPRSVAPGPGDGPRITFRRPAPQVPDVPMVPTVNLGDLFSPEGAEIYYVPAPRVPQVPDVPQVPFRARNGKHKLSTLTRRRPSRHSL